MNNLMRVQKLAIIIFQNTQEGKSLPGSCCDQEAIKAEKGILPFPKKEVLFLLVFIEDNIRMYPQQ